MDLPLNPGTTIAPRGRDRISRFDDRDSSHRALIVSIEWCQLRVVPRKRQ